MAAKKRILVVDDEPHIVELLAMNLEMNGYGVLSARDGPEAVATALAERPDIIILDLMLPGMGGLEVCRLLRKDHRTADTPVIMLTAKSEESDKVIGLGIGADDYVTKPFGLRELLARIEVALRHAAARGAPEGAVLEAGDLAIDEERHEVTRRGEPVRLSPTEFALLALMARNAGKAVRRADIVRELDVAGASEEARSLDVHVRNLRRKLGPRADGAPYLATLRGLGFRLDA